ncbi:DUF2914 domain-containing protein [Nitrosomonas halophila]|uniref:DUF2914 domain-containing protein n=1 Tax=Nitrosomonas halophila TaxID=44576 RepID=A0A1H3HZB3_9PROT|nr:DUF2914 domain-containing protein [Nitrosomonas halophila]SDY20807.1 Protein of unknown function [Nitrosomonas halophila]
MIQNTRLKIRIRLDQSMPGRSEAEQEADSLSRQSVAADYDWRKIMIAALTLLMVLSAMGWLIATWLADEDGSRQGVSNDSMALAQAPTHSESEFAASAPSPAVEKSPTEPSDNMQEGRAQGLEKPASKQGAADAPASRSSAEANADQILTPDIKPAAPDHEVGSNMVVVKPKANDHPSVLRAQLTSGIRRREPVDSIDHVPLAMAYSQPIYFYLHLSGLENEKVTVDWFYQEKHVARVILDTGASDWRTYSSKILDKSRIGAWRVVAFDQSGKLLAERGFKVTR